MRASTTLGELEGLSLCIYAHYYFHSFHEYAEFVCHRESWSYSSAALWRAPACARYFYKSNPKGNHSWTDFNKSAWYLFKWYLSPLKPWGLPLRLIIVTLISPHYMSKGAATLHFYQVTEKKFLKIVTLVLFLPESSGYLLNPPLIFQ